MYINNAMTIPQECIWQLGPGIKCLIKGGMYLYTGRSVDQLDRYMDLETGLELTEDEEEVQVDELVIDLEPDVDALFQAELRGILQLIDEGYKVEGRYFGLQDQLGKLEALAEVKKIVDDVKGNNG